MRGTFLTLSDSQNSILFGNPWLGRAAYAWRVLSNAHNTSLQNFRLQSLYCASVSIDKPFLQRHLVYLSRRSWELLLPTVNALPQYLSEMGYCNPTDPLRTSFSLGHHTSLATKPWLDRNPRDREILGRWLAVQRQGEPTWLDVFPAGRLTQLASSSSQSPLFVDIGGGVGHQCIELLQRHPSKRSVVLQDLDPLINLATAAKQAGVQCTVHNMWTPQPHQGAAIFYLRNLLHDFPDDQAVELLRIQAKAMSKDSVVVVDEMVLPDHGAPHWHAANCDIAMMGILAAKERNAALWRDLFARAKLSLQQSLRYSPLGHTAMILTAK